MFEQAVNSWEMQLFLSIVMRIMSYITAAPVWSGTKHIGGYED